MRAGLQFVCFSKPTRCAALEESTTLLRVDVAFQNLEGNACRIPEVWLSLEVLEKTKFLAIEENVIVSQRRDEAEAARLHEMASRAARKQPSSSLSLPQSRPAAPAQISHIDIESLGNLLRDGPNFGIPLLRRNRSVAILEQLDDPSCELFATCLRRFPRRCIPLLLGGNMFLVRLSNHCIGFLPGLRLSHLPGGL